MFTKVELYNVALSALLLERQLVDLNTDNSNEKAVLDKFYNTAFLTTLEDLNLDSTSTKAALELITNTPDSPYDQDWAYVYRYPSNCILFRGIYSGNEKDNRYTHIPKKVEMYSGTKVILTSEVNAIGVYIPKDISLTSLTPSTGMAIAHRLASLSSPLIVGKGALKLKQDILLMYDFHKSEAQRQDANENFNFFEDWVESEFVAERMS